MLDKKRARFVLPDEAAANLEKQKLLAQEAKEARESALTS